MFEALSRLRGVRVAFGIWLAVFLALGQTGLYAATYFVNAATGDDSRTSVEAQDSTTPWKTLTRAIRGTAPDANNPVNPDLSPGDTIFVAPGMYDTANGEEFPLTLVDGVRIIGSGPGATTIHAGDDDSVFRNVYYEGDLTALGSGTLLTNTTISAEPSSGFTTSFYGTRFRVGFTPLVELAPGDQTMSPRIHNNEFIGAEEARTGIRIDGQGGGATFDGLLENNTFVGFGNDPNDPAHLLDPNDPNSPLGFNVGWAVEIDANPFFTYKGAAKSSRVAASSTGPGIAPAAGPSMDTLSPTIRNNTFTGNFVGVGGVFYYPYAYFTPTIEYNNFKQQLFDLNTEDIFGGGALENAPTVRSNSTHDSGGTGMFQAALIEPQYFREFSPQFVGNRLENSGGIFTWAYFQDSPFFVKTGISPTVAMGTQFPVKPTFQGNQFTNGLLGVSAAFGGQITELDVNASDNTFDDLYLGFFLGTFATPYPIYDKGAPQQSATPLVSAPTITLDGNTFHYANYAAALYLAGDPNEPNDPNAPVVPAADISLTNNLFNDVNRGVSVGTFFFTTTSPLVSCNTFDNTGIGFFQAAQPDPPSDLGGGGTSLGNNSFNSNGDDIINDANDPNSVVFAQNNYFTTTPEVSSGVDVSSPLGVPPGCAATAGATIPTADLAMTKTAYPPEVLPGHEFTYTLTVTNHGPDDATNVEVVDNLPPEVTFVSASPECSESSGTVTCTLASLANGGTQQFQIIVQAPDYELTLVNGATVSSDAVDPRPANGSPTFGVGVNARAVGIPTVAEWGLILMTLLLGAAGLWMMRRRRHAGAVMMIVLAAGLVGPTARAADKPVREPGRHERSHPALRDQIPIHKVVAVQQNGGDVTFTWANGKTLVVPFSQLEMSEITWRPVDRSKDLQAKKGTARDTDLRPKRSSGVSLSPKALRAELSSRAGTADPGLWVMVGQTRNADGIVTATRILVFHSKQAAMLAAAVRAKQLVREHPDLLVPKN